MSDRSSATIKIGGKLTKAQAHELAKAIGAEGCGPDWSTSFDGDLEVEESIAAAAEAKTSLVLFADEATGGQFVDLENVCIKLGLSFVRAGEAQYNYDAEVRYFTPDGDWCWVGTIDGIPHLSASEIAKHKGNDTLDEALWHMMMAEGFAEPLKLVEETANV